MVSTPSHDVNPRNSLTSTSNVASISRRACSDWSRQGGGGTLRETSSTCCGGLLISQTPAICPRPLSESVDETGTALWTAHLGADRHRASAVNGDGMPAVEVEPALDRRIAAGLAYGTRGRLPSRQPAPRSSRCRHDGAPTRASGWGWDEPLLPQQFGTARALSVRQEVRPRSVRYLGCKERRLAFGLGAREVRHRPTVDVLPRPSPGGELVEEDGNLPRVDVPRVLLEPALREGTRELERESRRI